MCPSSRGHSPGFESPVTFSHAFNRCEWRGGSGCHGGRGAPLFMRAARSIHHGGRPSPGGPSPYQPTPSRVLRSHLRSQTRIETVQRLPLLSWDASVYSPGVFKGTQLSHHSWKRLKCGRTHPASAAESGFGNHDHVSHREDTNKFHPALPRAVRARRASSGCRTVQGEFPRRILAARLGAGQTPTRGYSRVWGTEGGREAKTGAGHLGVP